jgi:ribonuclease HII
MQGRTWKNVENSKAEEIKSYLLGSGGETQEVKSVHESWRIKFSDSTFTYYKKGTLYSTPSNSKDPAVFEAWEYIDSVVGFIYIPPTRDFLIGLDETGKGEVIGHTVLTGVIFPKEIFGKVDLLIGPADTKKRHKFEYWDKIFKILDHFRSSGLDFLIEKVTPWHVDRYNLNKIMDVSYQRILSIFFRRAEINRCRIVLDDYGIGATLRRFLKFLEKQGAEVIVTKNSEDEYLEAKTASLISKWTRERVIKAINENPEFQIDGLSIGSGNAGDKQTVEWLKKWFSSGRQWPWFVKRSFKTIWKIERRTGKPKKIAPPIREELLSNEFFEEFNKGKLSIQSLSIVCPACGSILKSATFAIFDKSGRRISELRCPNSECGQFIENAGITLRYYCGYVIPDSSAIQRKLISNDLNASRFFENFTVILTPVVRKECDGTQRGKKEFEELRKYDAIGRIKLETIGKVEDLPDNILGIVRDEKIIDACLEYNAILLTADKSMSSFASGKNVFTIFI